MPRVPGFALVVTVSLLLLLSLIAVGLLSLSTVAMRGSSLGSARAEARANARLGLMLALGELQKEMGPDMRVSAESALFDGNEDTEAIDGMDQSRWLASYNAWGDWLNGEYDPPGKGRTLEISDTYDARREAMFRRWLVSLPEGMERDIDAPDSIAAMGEDRSVVMVGSGTLGAVAESDPDQVTRAYLTSVGESGRQAWWIGPENHKARIDLGGEPRNYGAHQWETAHGDTAEVGVAGLPGFEALESEAMKRRNLVTTATLRPAGVGEREVNERFFDLTGFSRGVIASVRAGHLKKDLSLLFEQSSMPPPFDFARGRAVQEPSIRPMSPELQDKNPTIPNRHFASWTNMRHFYRMYRGSSDATIAGTGGSGALEWERSTPYTDFTMPLHNAGWEGENNYLRMPVLAKISFIYSLMSEPVPDERGKYNCYLVYTPIFTYWNPYNTALRIPDETFGSLTSAYKILPIEAETYKGVTLQDRFAVIGSWAGAFLKTSGRGDIRFDPGELRVFAFQNLFNDGNMKELEPGFNPQAIGGDRMLIFEKVSSREQPGLAISFSHSYWGGNIHMGNSPGSLSHTPFWEDNGKKMPPVYAHDWLNKDQTYTRITPDPSNPGNIARWTFGDSEPLPVGYTQLVIKGQSEFDYESIDWDQDWRSRNWLQAPPYYFGSATYVSENRTIADTQRMDSPYVLNFGPMSMAEMPKVVGHIDDRAFLGSGANPFEKVTSVSTLELPTAPVGSLAGFAGMRINPGWTRSEEFPGTNEVVRSSSLAANQLKAIAYQSGVTGPGIGNSFVHPMLPRDEVYRYFDNSKSQDANDLGNPRARNPPTVERDNKVFNDFWDHVLLLNDALWDDYFLSSLADQNRPGATAARSMEENIETLAEGGELANSRYRYHSTGQTSDEVIDELEGADGYLKAAKHLMVDGMFNVNSTSVPAWHALFLGIRERRQVYRDRNGNLETIEPPSDNQIVISRFNTATSDQEMEDPEFGVSLGDGNQGWTGVRFLDDRQLRVLAEQCVKQVKLRGPFLNFSEFINRRLSTDELGVMGALQSAIDFDDGNLDPDSINYRFKNGPDFMIEQSDLGRHAFATPEAMVGSRFAGIPGYVIQSDLLKPIANTLSVRDDTFRIRAYGDAVDSGGEVIARAWCEAVVQRVTEYHDPANDADVPARLLDSSGSFTDNSALTEENRKFGRRFEVIGFRWLGADEV